MMMLFEWEAFKEFKNVSSLAYFRAFKGFLMIIFSPIWLEVSLLSSELDDPSSSTWMSNVKVDP